MTLSLPISCAARADCFLESYYKHVMYVSNSLQMLRDKGQGILVLFGLAQVFKLWHGRSRREPRKQEGS